MAETLDVLKKLGKSVARGVPQLATGFVDLAALPLTMTGLRQPEQIFGSTAYLTDKGLLPQPQTGLLNEGAELASSMVNPAGLAKVGLIGALAPAKYIGKTLVGAPIKFVLLFIKFFSSNIFVNGFHIKKLNLDFCPPNALPALKTSMYPSLLKSPLQIA